MKLAKPFSLVAARARNAFAKKATESTPGCKGGIEQPEVAAVEVLAAKGVASPRVADVVATPAAVTTATVELASTAPSSAPGSTADELLSTRNSAKSAGTTRSSAAHSEIEPAEEPVVPKGERVPAPAQAGADKAPAAGAHAKTKALAPSGKVVAAPGSSATLKRGPASSAGTAPNASPARKLAGGTRPPTHAPVPLRVAGKASSAGGSPASAVDKGKRPMAEVPAKPSATSNRPAAPGRVIKPPSDPSAPSSSSGYSTPSSSRSRNSLAGGSYPSSMKSAGGSSSSSSCATAASAAEELVAQLVRTQQPGGHSRNGSASSGGLPNLAQLLSSVDSLAAAAREAHDGLKVKVPKASGGKVQSGERVRDSARSSLHSARSTSSSLLPARSTQAGGVDKQTLSTLATLGDVQYLLSNRSAGGQGASAKVLTRAVRQLCSPDPAARQVGISKVMSLFGEEYGLLIVTVVLLVAQLS